MEDLFDTSPTLAPTMEATTRGGWTYEDYEEWVREAQQRRAQRIYGGILFIFVLVSLRVIGGNLWDAYQRRRRRILSEEVAAMARERRHARIQNGLKFITWHKEEKKNKKSCTTAIEDTDDSASLSALEEGASGDDKTTQQIPNVNEASLAMDTDNGVDDEDNEATCAICFTPFEDGQVICGSNNPDCPHMYCTECISLWLLQNEECPTCRRRYLTWPVNETKNNDRSSDQEEVPPLEPLEGGGDTASNQTSNQTSDQASMENETSTANNDTSNETSNTNTTRAEENV